MRPFGYASPRSLDEAVSLLAPAGHRQGGARPLAGGTDLLTLMKADLCAPDQLIDIKRLADLDDRIADGPDGLTIGALATLTEIEDDPLVRTLYPALAEAAALAATPQLRNMATIGGNLLQRPRCWYFRNPHLSCWLKGGEACPARSGENQRHALFDVSPCVAVFFAIVKGSLEESAKPSAWPKSRYSASNSRPRTVKDPSSSERALSGSRSINSPESIRRSARCTICVGIAITRAP